MREPRVLRERSKLTWPQLCCSCFQSLRWKIKQEKNICGVGKGFVLPPLCSSPGYGGREQSAQVNPTPLKKRKLTDAAGDKDNKKRIRQHRAEKQTKKQQSGRPRSDLKGALRRCCVCSADDVSPFTTSTGEATKQTWRPLFCVFWGLFSFPKPHRRVEGIKETRILEIVRPCSLHDLL